MTDVQPTNRMKQGAKQGAATRATRKECKAILHKESLVVGIPLPTGRKADVINMAEYVMAYLLRMADRNVVLKSFTHRLGVHTDRLLAHIPLPTDLVQDQILHFSMDPCKAHALMTDWKHYKPIVDWMLEAPCGGYLDKTTNGSPENSHDNVAHMTALYIVALCCLKKVSPEKHELLAKFGGLSNPVLKYKQPAEEIVLSKGTAHSLLNKSTLNLEEHVDITGAYYTNYPYNGTGENGPIVGRLADRRYPFTQRFMVRGTRHNMPKVMERVFGDLQHGLKEDNDKLLAFFMQTLNFFPREILQAVKAAMVAHHVDALRALLADD